MYDLSVLNLRLFVQVCEQRSIARVAQVEALVASAISKRLAQLEHQMGAPLFIRERRGLRPTAAGETLLEHARIMLAAANQTYFQHDVFLTFLSCEVCFAAQRAASGGCCLASVGQAVSALITASPISTVPTRVAPSS